MDEFGNTDTPATTPATPNPMAPATPGPGVIDGDDGQDDADGGVDDVDADADVGT